MLKNLNKVFYPDELETPNPIWHRNLSFLKSDLRIIAGLFLITSSLLGAGVFFILAEIVGVLEEMV